MTTKRKNEKNTIINFIREKTLFVSLMEAKFRHYHWGSPAYNTLELFLRHRFHPQPPVRP